MKTFELIRDFNENGINLKKGDYTLQNLINIYGTEDKFNFCFKATSLKEVLKEKIETPEDKLEIKKPEDNIQIETQEISVETPEDKLEIETKAKKSSRKGK